MTEFIAPHFTTPSLVTGLTAAKGDLVAGRSGGGLTSLSVGENDRVLVADSTQASGLRWGTAATQTHASSHLHGGSDELNADRLALTYSPLHYTPSTQPVEVDDAAQLTAHLAGIDAVLADAHSPAFLTLTDTPSAFTGAANALLAVNTGASAVEFTGQHVGTVAASVGTALGAGSSCAGENAAALGPGAVANVASTVALCGPPVLRKAAGVSSGDEHSALAGSTAVYATRIIDLTATGTYTINVPSAATFVPREIVVHQTTAGTVDATLAFGTTGDNTRYGNISHGASASLGSNRILTALPSLDSPVGGVLQARVTTADDSAGACRVFFVGILVENE